MFSHFYDYLKILYQQYNQFSIVYAQMVCSHLPALSMTMMHTHDTRLRESNKKVWE